jgi:hypothetical protein
MWSRNITQQMEAFNFLFLASHICWPPPSSLHEKKLTSNSAGMISAMNITPPKFPQVSTCVYEE